MHDNWVILEEQGLRDGLQTLTLPISTEQKLRWITQLVAAGLPRIQVSSFVHPRLVPQMADAEALCAQLPRDSTATVFSGLALNVRGVERAAAAGLTHIAVSFSASDTHSRRNAGMSLDEAIAEFGRMVTTARAHGMHVRGGLQCAFGCRFEGCVATDHVLRLVAVLLQHGVDEIVLADSTGMGHPQAVRRLLTEVSRMTDGQRIGLHLHDTERKGLANMYAALEAGVRYFDTAFGGLGGCPFIKGATGNIATEDAAHLLQQMGLHTGIDVAAVSRVSQEMEELLGSPLPGALYRLYQQSTTLCTA